MLLVKDWIMIHKIKAMYDDDREISIKEVGWTLEISRDTVRKYFRTDELQADEYLADPRGIRCRIDIVVTC